MLPKLLTLLFILCFITVLGAHRRIKYIVQAKVIDHKGRPAVNRIFLFSNSKQSAYTVTTDSLGNFNIPVNFILPCTSGTKYSLERTIEICEGYNGKIYRLYDKNNMALLPNSIYKRMKMENNILKLPSDTIVFKLQKINANGIDKYLSLVDKL